MYAIVDIETTGGSPVREKITEIAIYVHDGEKIVNEYNTLINPEKPIPAHITGITGITNEMVMNAPRFYEVAKTIVEMTENKLFVAHNSNFDYRFIQQEFKQLGYDFKRDQICTVKLSRKLIPGHRSYSLGNLCNDLNIKIEGRHRAAGDALATTHLFELLLSLNNFDNSLFSLISDISKKGLHPSFRPETLKNLPEGTGVYYFYADNGDIIYIGKSKNIKARVINHFGNNGTKKGLLMKENISEIDYVLTGNELIALLLESDEIKKHKPRYNHSQRRAMQQYGIYMFEDENGYQNLKMDNNASNEEAPIISFSTREEALQHLNILMSEHNLCQKLCGTYKTKGGCFHYQVGLCHGACLGEEGPESYNLRVSRALEMFSYPNENIMIIDKGRHSEERSVIRIEQGKYMGFGYFDINEAASYPGILDECISYKQDNRDTLNIIKSYLKKHNVEKIIKF